MAWTVRLGVAAPLALVAWIGAPAMVVAATPTEKNAEGTSDRTDGASLFRTYCASCHGVTAKGDGPLANSLRVLPPDLTRFAKRAGGKFDADKVARIVDGRDPVKGHGGSDMPVWGDAFKRSHDGYSEKAVKQRIDDIVEYVKTLQMK
jgi:mono/diheme cytochrome c family protein